MANAAVAKDNLDENEDSDAEAGEANGEGAKKKRRFSGKKIVLFAVLPILLLGGGLKFGLLDMLGFGDKPAEEAVVAPKEAVYFDVPDMLVNLHATGKQPTYLKLSVSLEYDDPLLKVDLDKALPRIVDRFQVYLRELRAEDISGSAGVYRLKEELLSRVNAAITPKEVKDVLFREMLVQ